jgi:hypothetical protein
MAIKSQSAIFARGDGAATEIFTEIGEVVSFSLQNDPATEINTTHLTSTAQEFVMGLRGSVVASMELNLDTADTEQTGLRTDRDTQTLRNFKITLSNLQDITFSAYVKSFSITNSADDAVRATVELRGSGAETWL